MTERKSVAVCVFALTVAFSVSKVTYTQVAAATNNAADRKAQTENKKSTVPKNDQSMNSIYANRPARWGILLNYNTGEDLYDEWAKLRAVILVPEGVKSENGQYPSFQVFRDLSVKPPKGTIQTRLEVSKVNRVWLVERNADPLQKLSKFLRVESPTPFIAFFIPRELESELLEAELAFGKKSEKELSEGWFTVFEVKRNREKFEVEVISQKKEEPKK